MITHELSNAFVCGLYLYVGANEISSSWGRHERPPNSC
eukprot:COSAG01_NODE_5600_length_4154_cov_46.611344_8_plen_38_part_00